MRATKLFSVIGLLTLICTFSVSYGQEIVNDDAPDVEASQEILDISGTWVGTRNQYNRTQTDFIQKFDYIFELSQEGNVVTGTSYIESENGDYAEVMIKGTVVENKFYFEEYGIIDEQRPDNKVWCYKVGVLDFNLEDEVLGVLTGSTNSYTSTHYYPCTGGETYLERLEDYNVDEMPVAFKDEVDDPTNIIDLNIDLGAFPNPYFGATTITYTIEENRDVRVEVFEISGKLVTTLVNDNLDAGQYQVEFNGGNHGYAAGAFIVKLTAGDDVASTQLIQMN